MAALAGRLDLLDPSAHPPEGAASALSGAALVLAAADEPPERLFARTAGAFTLVAADPRRGTLSVARDHLGAHKVYVHLGRRWFLAASEPAPLLAHAAVSADPDEAAAARFLGFRFGHGERSFFREIDELPPAHRLEVDAAGVRRQRLWSLRPRRVESEASAPAAFLARLAGAVERDVADVGPERVALSLGGGLDSSALAALVPPGVRAFSWDFEETPDAEERAHVEAVSAHLGLPLHRVDGDAHRFAWDDYLERFAHPESPYVNAFAALKAHLYAAARAAGCTRMMVGDAGDALYAAQEHWLRDALAERGAGAVAGLGGALAGAWRGDPAAKVALRRLLPASPRSRRPRPRWLTAAATARLPHEGPSPILPPGRGWRRHELVAGARNVELESEERRLFARCGVERSNPFWSWPLVELTLGLPAHWLHRGGTSKLLTRRALAGRLPERVLASRRVGLLGDYFLRGIEAERERLRDEVFRRPRSDWQRWVDRGFVEPYLEGTGTIRFGHTILWRVISYEMWQRRTGR